MVSYDRRVFINCPFDNDYLPLLQAIAFAVIDCGFSPRLAIQEVNGRLRLEKMIDLMRASRLSIHDISRLPAAPGELPRFNMPFECGVSGPIQSISRVVTRSQLLINRPCSRRLAHTHNPLRSKYRTLICVARRLMNANKCHRSA